MRLLFIFGTRPEAIKLAPLIRDFQKDPQFSVSVCITAQHRQMLDQVMEFFQIKADFDLDIMKANQTLFDVTADGLKKLEKIFDHAKPELIFVQGDTTTAFIGALAAYYKKIKVAHIEAGLRSGNKLSPFPEEMNRVMTGHIADYHFAPTTLAAENLAKENIDRNIFVTGNTVIDALFLGLEIIKNNSAEFEEKFSFISAESKTVLITGHRRESFGKPFENICNAIHRLAVKNPSVHFIYPVHLNPNVQEPVKRLLSDVKNIHLIEPLEYPEFIWLMNKAYLVLTDSGGLQEEAPSLGKPVIVMREVTERKEGIDAGTAVLVGTNEELIIETIQRLLDDKTEYEKMAKAVNPYGDGKASERIVEVIKKSKESFPRVW
jgi:UDP-N-acetylglucosamine 2-epimerase (non-hydrolysing)